jgi:hypothetical protein
MASELKRKTQEAIEGLRERVSDCDLAMLVDRETGLILSKSTETTVSQNLLETIANTARGDLDSMLSNSVSDLSENAALLSVSRVEKSGVTVVFRSLLSADEALVCRFTSPPDRAELSISANAVFEVSLETEAA